ncbi:UNVERIFIED_CONTAM: hypothetical protein Sindi_0717600, partial [Sesamum indicum]
MTSLLSHFIPRNAPFLIEINALSHLLNPKWLGRGKVPFFEGTPGNRSSGDGVGPVAQRIRARGYEPRCRGVRIPPRPTTGPKGKYLSLWGRKIMIGISGPKAMELG